MDSKKLATAASLYVFALVLSCSASLSCEPGTEHGIGIHSGIFDVCKNYLLVGSKPKDLSINDDSPQFKKIEDWVGKNLLNTCYIAAKVDGKEKAHFWLNLSSDRLPQKTVPEAFSKMLVTIPLTNQTLGPNFKEKIKELQVLMQGKLQSNSEAQ